MAASGHAPVIDKDTGLALISMKAHAPIPVQLPLTDQELLEATAEAGIAEVDPITGEPCSPEELRFRMLIHKQREMGYIAIDATYEAVRLDVHKPLVHENSGVIDDTWTLPREGVVLQVPMGGRDQGRLAEADIVQLVQYAAGDYAAVLMHHLFAIANDPPYYRRPVFEVNVSTLLDRMGYKRDSRGLHYSTARRRLTRTLLALQSINLQIVRRPSRQGGKTTGVVAPLLSGVMFATRGGEDTGQMNATEIFTQGLPAVVKIHINPIWYAGVREHDGRPGSNYKLLPPPDASVARVGPVRRGRRSKTVELLRPYIERMKESLTNRAMTVTKATLLEIANITNKNVTMASKTLTDALERLCEDGTVLEYNVQGSSAGDLVRIRW